MYPSEDDVLRCEPVLQWIDDNFLRPDPFAFKDVNNGFRSTAALIAQELDVDRNGIFCIGSGAVGISLNPNKLSGGKLKRYDEGSDLDIAVISETYFETAWRDLRRASQPTLGHTEIEAEVRENLQWQKKKFFDGAILTTHLLPALSFSPKWVPSLVRIEERAALMLDREIKIGLWIYRDYWSLRNYVSEGLMKCRKTVMAE